MLKILVTPPVTAEHKRLLEAAGGPDAEWIYRDAGAVDAALMQEVDILFGNVAPALVAGAKSSGCFNFSARVRTAISPFCRQVARLPTRPAHLALPSANICSACC